MGAWRVTRQKKYSQQDYAEEHFAVPQAANGGGSAAPLAAIFTRQGFWMLREELTMPSTRHTLSATCCWPISDGRGH